MYFFLFFSSEVLSDPLYLRFNEVQVINESSSSSKGYGYSKKIEKVLLKNLITIGDFSKNKLTLGIKRYNIIIRKDRNNNTIFFADEKKICIHNLEGFLLIHGSQGLKLFYEEFRISSSKLISTNNYNTKKKINDEVSSLLSEKLIPELRRIFSTNLGDLINPV